MSRFDNWPKGAWSHSRWAELRRCPKAHDLRYNQRLYRIGQRPEALEIGSCFHRACELIGLDVLAGHDTHDTALWDEAIRIARSECKSPGAGLQATRLWGAYQKRWGHANAGYGNATLLAVETVLTGGDLHSAVGGYAAIADAAIEDERGIWIVETKTAARKPSGSDEEIERDIAMQDQVLGLTYCARLKWGDRVQGVLRNIVVKTSLVSFMRPFVEISNEAIDNWLRDQREAEQMVGLTCANRDACAPPMGFRCDYFDYCHASSLGDHEDAVAELYYKKEQRNVD
jgi:hypothetical protein